jgi:metal-responsive CopG/Arc/MetJ family transcriptional regulator
MPVEKDPRIIIPMSQELVAAIDEYRFENRLPSRAEAIRGLLEFALQTVAQQEHADQKEKA